MKDNKFHFSNLINLQNNCVADESKKSFKMTKTLFELRLFEVYL